MQIILIKAAIIIFLVIPLVLAVIWLGLSMMWLQVKEKENPSPAEARQTRDNPKTQDHYTRRRRRLTSA
jgi:flagellar basal body-associated protein FliL